MENEAQTVDQLIAPTFIANSQDAAAPVVTEADIAGVATDTEHAPGWDEAPKNNAADDHESLLVHLLGELEHIEHMGKSEIAAVLAKFRALV